MTHLNVFQTGEQLENIQGYSVEFNGLPVDEKSQRHAYQQSIVSTLCRNGIDATVAPRNDPGDILLAGEDRKAVDAVKSRYSDFKPEVVEKKQFSDYEIGQVWKDYVRTRLLENGFLKIGSRYVREKDITDQSTEFKDAFRIQADFVNGRPTLFVDPRTRIMTPLSGDEIKKAKMEGEESEVSVQILPNWRQGFLVGTADVKAGDREFTYQGREYPLPEYWERKHSIGFVDEDDDLVQVYIPDFDDTLDYPVSCVFSSFQRGTSLPNDLKGAPNERVNESEGLVSDLFASVEFAGRSLRFGGPVSTDHLGYSTEEFDRFYEFDVAVGGEETTSVDDIHKSLQRNGPYAGKTDGKYVVVAPENSSSIRDGFDELESIYRQLNLGTLERAREIGDEGIISVDGRHETDYTSTITNIRSQLEADDSLRQLQTSYHGVDYDFSEDILFTYMEIGGGPQLDRLDMPRWVMEEDLVEYVLSVVRAECGVGRGYPEILQAVDADAVISRQDREEFLRMYQDFSDEHDIELRWNSKALSKKRRRR